MRQVVPTVAVICALLALLALGGALRWAELDRKPMHTDEAVQAVKFGQLLEAGYYRYDPAEFHGPTLYYLTLLPARITGAATVAQVSEALLRRVPAAFGLGLILLLPLFREGLGRPGILTAALLTAVSPILVYYSRYYIQETLLVFFTLAAMGCGWRYVFSLAPSGAGALRPPRRHPLAWAILTGLFLGLMHATKETAIFPFAAWTVALAPLAWRQWAHHRNAMPPARTLGLQLAAAGVTALAVSVLFYSSMFTHARGPLDSILTYFSFAHRAGGQGHEKPWSYYLSILVWHREAGYRSSELLILVLAAVGGAVSFTALGRDPTRNRLGRFLSIYCALLFLVYSLIPYKTPWLIMGCVQGATLLAGVAVATLWDRFRHPVARVILVVALLAGSADLARQAWIGGTRFGADERNPYAYSHTAGDALRLADRIHALADLHPDGRRMTVKVVAEEYWPLPWYLRDFERVGYWNALPDDPRAPVVITSPTLADEVEARLGDDYVPDLFGLRPGVFLVAYIRGDLWDRLIGGGVTNED